MTEQSGINIYFRIFDKLLSHKLILVISFLSIGLSGTYVVNKLPNIYKSSTLILVEPQKIPENYVQSTINYGVDQRLQTLTQEVMSRTRLLTVIKEFNLYNYEKIKKYNAYDNDKNPGYILYKIIPGVIIKKLESYPRIMKLIGVEKEMSISDALALMRSNIQIEVKNSKSKNGVGNYFTISFKDRDQYMAMNITNKLSALFIGENLKIREQQIEGTTEFLEKELINTQDKLEIKEQEIKRFRKKYMGELPEQMQTNLHLLDQFHSRLQSINESLRNAIDRNMLNQKQLNDNMLIMLKNKKVDINTGKEEKELPLEKKLEILKSKLVDMKTKLTEKHPDIKNLRREIQVIGDKIREEEAIEINESEKLKELIKEETILKDEEIKITSIDQLFRSNMIPLESTRAVMIQLEKTNLEIKSLREDKEKLEKQIKKLGERIERIPKREQQLIKIMRDYDLMKANYKSLYEKKLQAKLSENLEKKQKGEQFRILDSANFPENPFSPNRPRYIFICFFAGLAIGTSLSLAIEFIVPKFHDVEEVEGLTDIPVIAIVPRFKN